MPEINEDVLLRLAAKLDALDLDEAEQAALDGIIARAEAFEPEVEGFAFEPDADSASLDPDAYTFSGQRSGAGLSGTSLKLGGGLGFVLRAYGER